MPADELFLALLIPSLDTGNNAPRELLEDCLIQSGGKGVVDDPRRYFATDLGRTKRELASQHATENAGRHLRGPR